MKVKDIKIKLNNYSDFKLPKNDGIKFEYVDPTYSYLVGDDNDRKLYIGDYYNPFKDVLRLNDGTYYYDGEDQVKLSVPEELINYLKENRQSEIKYLNRIYPCVEMGEYIEKVGDNIFELASNDMIDKLTIITDDTYTFPDGTVSKVYEDVNGEKYVLKYNYGVVGHNHIPVGDGVFERQDITGGLFLFKVKKQYWFINENNELVSFNTLYGRFPICYENENVDEVINNYDESLLYKEYLDNYLNDLFKFDDVLEKVSVKKRELKI